MLHKDALESLKQQVEAISAGDRLTVSVPASISTADFASLLSNAGLMLLGGTADGRTLYGIKPHRNPVRVSAVMSMPRLAFTSNMFSVFEALPPLNIPVRTVSNPYWGQGIERAIESAIEQDNAEAVLTIDYDTLFSSREVSMLIQLMACYPEADAIAAIQCHRGKGLPMYAPDPQTFVSTEHLTRVRQAHFGLTLLSVEKLKSLPKPWFHDIPAPDHTWGEGRTDADMAFWKKWESAGNSLFLGTRVPVGHLELMIVWPGQDQLKGVYQSMEDYRANGMPKDAWR